MGKVKTKLKNIIYSIGFLFRPITPVAFSFVFLVISSALLGFILAKRYDQKEKDSTFYDEAPKYLQSIIEKAIFLDRHIFRNYFEVTDIRYELAKDIDAEEYLENHKKDKDTEFEFRSNMISRFCGHIDKAMKKLQRRVGKEPYFWPLASYKEKKR